MAYASCCNKSKLDCRRMSETIDMKEKSRYLL